jgi:hypothetical protein
LGGFRSVRFLSSNVAPCLMENPPCWNTLN